MKFFNFLIIFLCLSTHSAFANSLICSDFVKFEAGEKNKKEVGIDRLDIRINPIEGTNKSYFSFKFHGLMDDTGPELAMDLNLNQFTSPFEFSYGSYNKGVFSGKLSPVEYGSNLFLELVMHLDIVEMDNASTVIVPIDLSGLMQCKWEPPQ